MIEFAICLPFFVIILFGIIEFSRGFMVQQILTNAAREGARKAVVAGSSNTAAEQAVDNYLAAMEVTGFSRTVTPNVQTMDSGDAITVTVTCPFSAVSWGLMDMLADNTLGATCVMRKE